MKTLLDFQSAYAQQRPITMLTCYDATSASIAQQSTVDCLLVGDSVAMTVHGYPDTLHATVEMIALHTAAVRRGAPDMFVIADMPFLAHRGSRDTALQAVRTLMVAGANAIKVEGIDGSEERLRTIIESGVPLMGHLGLTPQSVNMFGGFRVQGRTESSAEKIYRQAQRLAEIGVFGIVLECIPNELAERVTESLDIPTIGIGAGSACSGQVLVWQDVLGLNTRHVPRFVRSFAHGAEETMTALSAYADAVRARTFPNQQESYGG